MRRLNRALLLHVSEGSRENLVLYQDHTSEADNILNSQYLSDWHFIEIVRRIYVTITPGS